MPLAGSRLLGNPGPICIRGTCGRLAARRRLHVGSPFPGMDPYLEGELWQEFHETLASAIRAQLMPRLTPKYVALLAKRYVLDHPALGVFDTPVPRVVYPDVHVVSPPEAAVSPVAPLSVTTDAPTIEPANFVEVPQLSIEILSPANMPGDGADEYIERRRELLRLQPLAQPDYIINREAEAAIKVDDSLVG